MVVSALNEEIICIVKDIRENAEVEKFKIVVRPQDTVQNLFKSAGTLTPLPNFELTLEASQHNYVSILKIKCNNIPIKLKIVFFHSFDYFFAFQKEIY